MTPPRAHLLIIDPQNDFIEPDAKPNPWAPALPVPGSQADMRRLATLIDKRGANVAAITVTLDSHHRLDIAHPAFWIRGDGSPVEPFTPVRAAQVASGEILPRIAGATARVKTYLEQLEASGQHTHMIWPVHCELGTWGHAIHPAVQTACSAWETRTLQPVSFVLKGLNPWTEHFSALSAEVPDPLDPSTQTHQALLADLQQADCVYIAGEAGSHCVKRTVEDLVAHWDPARYSSLVLLQNAMSPVAGFESQQASFLDDMRNRGLRLMTTDEAQEALASRG